jgi:Flp pilus assembly protein TadB
MTGPLVAGPGVAPVPAPGPDRRHHTTPTAGSVAARVRTLGRAVLAAMADWWQGQRAARWGPPAAALVGAGVGFVLAGPVAAAALSAYGAAGFVIARGFAARRAIRRAQRLAGDAVLGFAADLRAGLALGPAWRTAEEALRQAESGLLVGWRGGRGGSAAGGPVTVVAQRLAAATALAEACGAPLADVLDRLDAHVRAVQRAQATADSQAAGVRASAALLAVMPVAGLGLGVAVGVDPWQVLLHTTPGSFALGLAVALQLVGIAWTARLAHIEVRP